MCECVVIIDGEAIETKEDLKKKKKGNNKEKKEDLKEKDERIKVVWEGEEERKIKKSHFENLLKTGVIFCCLK